MLLGGTCPGSVMALGVVGVLAVGDGVQLLRLDDLVVDAGEQLVLAVEAAAGVVRLVVRVLALAGGHLDHLGPDHRGDPVGQAAFAAGQGRRDAQQRHDVLAPEGADGQGQQGRGVHASGVGDADPAVASQLLGDGVGQLQGLAGERLRGHRVDVESRMVGVEQGGRAGRDVRGRAGDGVRGHWASLSSARRNSTSPAWSMTRVSGSLRRASMSRLCGSTQGTLYSSQTSGGMEVAKERRTRWVSSPVSGSKVPSPVTCVEWASSPQGWSLKRSHCFVKYSMLW